MGGGGPAKAAEPKVTPFVDYSAQTPDIPNWFANRTANAATLFTPDFSQSQAAFGNTGIVPPAQNQPVQQALVQLTPTMTGMQQYNPQMPGKPLTLEELKQTGAQVSPFAIPTPQQTMYNPSPQQQAPQRGLRDWSQWQDRLPQSGMMRNDDPRRNQNSFDGRMPFPPDGFEDPFARRMRFAIPTQHMGGEEMMRPRRPRAAYQNYTDTDPTMSTGADGAPLMGPNSIWPGRR